MGFKFQKRVNLGKGIGLNISKSGVSPSVRSKYGSLSPKGFSVRTGVPGLSYRGNNKNAVGVMAIVGIIAVGFFFARWVVRKTYQAIFTKKPNP